MIREFKTASIIPFNLQPLIQDMLQRKDYKPNPAVRQILSSLESATSENAYKIMDKTLQIIEEANAIDRFGESFFSYRQGKVPPSVYYVTIAGNRILKNPSLFPNLPEDFNEVEHDYNMLALENHRIVDPSIGVKAKFCYGINRYFLLKDFLDDLRTGRRGFTDPDSLQDYREWVVPAYGLVNGEDELSGEIGNLIKKISFVINHHESIFCDFIRFGAEHKEELFDKKSLFDLLPDLKSLKTEHIFNVAFESLLARHGEANHDFFYEFCEKIVLPINMFYMIELGADPICLDYMIARATLQQADDPKTALDKLGPDIKNLCEALEKNFISDSALGAFKIKRSHINSMSASLAIADLSFSAFKLGGNSSDQNQRPDIPPQLYNGSDICDLYNKLVDGRQIEIDNPNVRSLWYASRSAAVEHIEIFINEFPNAVEELGLHPGRF